MAVSVVIGTLNRREVLAYTLSVLSRQVLPEDEIIIVDDGSVEEDAEFFRTVQLPCKKVVIRHERNMGRFPSKNQGMLAASNEILIQLDNDAWLVERDALRIVEQIMRENPRIGALAIPMHYHYASNADECGSLSRRWSFGEMQIESTYMGCGVGLRRSAVIEAGLYPEFYVYGPEEETLSARLMKVGYEVRGTRRVRCIHGHSELTASATYQGTRDRKPDLDVTSNQYCLAIETLAWPFRPVYLEWILLKGQKKGLTRREILSEVERKRQFLDLSRHRFSFGMSVYWCALRGYVYCRNWMNRRTLLAGLSIKQ